MSHLRPISLCNVVYKIASKVLVNRLKGLMPNIDSVHQSVFVPGRQIFDNTILASKIAQDFFKKNKEKKRFMAIKLDMSKAFNCIEWCYLHDVLVKLAFARGWVYLIMIFSFPPLHGGTLCHHLEKHREGFV